MLKVLVVRNAGAGSHLQKDVVCVLCAGIVSAGDCFAPLAMTSGLMLDVVNGRTVNDGIF